MINIPPASPFPDRPVAGFALGWIVSDVGVGSGRWVIVSGKLERVSLQPL